MSLLSDEGCFNDSPIGLSPTAEMPGPVTPPTLPSPVRHFFARSATSPLPHTHTVKPQIRFAPLVHITSGIKDVIPSSSPSILCNAADRVTAQPAFLNTLPGCGQQPASASSSLASSFDMPLRSPEPVAPGVGLDQVTPPKKRKHPRRKPTPVAKPITSTSRFYERLSDDEDDEPEPSSDEGGSEAVYGEDPFAVTGRPTERSRLLRPSALPRLRLAYSPSSEDLAASEARERAALLAKSESKRRLKYGTSGMVKRGRGADALRGTDGGSWWRNAFACWGCWDLDEDEED